MLIVLGKLKFPCYTPCNFSYLKPRIDKRKSMLEQVVVSCSSFFIYKSFARISSSLLMRQISEELKIELSKVAVRYEISWDANDNVLVINTKKRKRKQYIFNI